MAQERVIKKYANRRLYDARGSRHVTLDDIRKIIAGGERVKVVDDKSGADLTRAVLLQVIAEQEQFGTPVLSTDLLESIIRFYGNPVQQMLTSYMEQSVSGLLKQQQVMQAEIAKTFESPMAPIAELTQQNMERWAKLQSSLLSGFAPPAPKDKDDATAPNAHPRGSRKSRK